MGPRTALAWFAVTVLAVLAGGSAAAAHAASPPWSAPADASRSTAFIFDPRVAFDERGNALLTWLANAGKHTFADPTAGPGAASFRYALRTGTTWNAERALSPRILRLIPYGRRLALGIAEDTPRASLSAVWVDSESGRITRTQRLDSKRRVDGVSLSVNGRGEAVVAWSATSGRRHRVRVAIRRHGHLFSRPSVVSGPSATDPQANIDERGDAVVAWVRARRQVEARVRRGHRSLGPVKRLGPTANGHALRVAAGPGGRAAVGWTSQGFCCGDGGEPTGPALLRFAYARTKGHFNLAGEVDTFERITPPQIAFNGINTGYLAWAASGSASGDAVRVTRFDDAGQLAAPQTLAASSAPSDGLQLVRLATGPAGSGLVAWIEGDLGFSPQFPTRLMASYTGGGTSPFGPAENASPPDEDVLDADAAIEPRTERPLAVWSREQGGASGRILRASQRP